MSDVPTPVDDRGRPTYPPPEPEGPVHHLAVASLILSVVWLLGAGSILALIFGYRSRREIEREPFAHTGRGIALIGIVIGWIGVAGAILVTVVTVTIAMDDPDGFCDEDRIIVDPDC